MDTPSTEPSRAIGPLDLLRDCAANAPAPWFPSDFCQRQGVDRQAIDEALWLLRSLGLIRVTDWFKGRGQAFALTEAGLEALRLPPETLATSSRVGSEAAPANKLSGYFSRDLSTAPDTQSGEVETYYDRGEANRQALLSPHRPVMVWFLLWANIVWFLFGGAMSVRGNVGLWDYLKDPTGPMLVRIGACFGPSLLQGEWWRLISCAFVHVGLLHLLLNTLALYSIGPIAESVWGRKKLLALYLLSALGGSCLAMALKPTTAIAGASGAIWGLIAAIVLWLLRARNHLPPELAQERLGQFLLLIVINCVLSFAPQVSWEGHLGGAATGVVVSLLLSAFQATNRRRWKVFCLLGLVMVPLAWGGLLLSLMQYHGKWKFARVVAAPTMTAEEQDQLLKATSLPRVAQAHQSALAALITRNPDSLNAAQIEVQAIQTAAQRLTKQLAPGEAEPVQAYRQYLTKLQAFCVELNSHLAARELPTSQQSQKLGRLRQHLDESWQHLLQFHSVK